jgi:hypothetical protein
MITFRFLPAIYHDAIANLIPNSITKAPDKQQILNFNTIFILVHHYLDNIYTKLLIRYASS